MSENPSALGRLMREFLAADLDARDSGIYAAKSGYHNTRAHHLAGSHNGSKGDYSIELAIDRQGPSDKAAAVDLSFDSARLLSDFSNIAVYSRRLYDAFKARDPRLFAQVPGQPAGVEHAVVREFFGNIDADRDVEGWSLYLGQSRTSDSSHLWHIHISFHRAYVENWGAVSGVLDVLLDRPTPTPEDDMPTAQEIAKAFLEAKIGPQRRPVEEYIVGIRSKLDAMTREGWAEDQADDLVVGQAVAGFRGELAEIRDLLTKALSKEDPS